MVRWILGTAGSGKTAQVLLQAEEKAKQGKKVLLLVPEQYSLEMEKILSRRSGSASSLGVEVYSFTRLCEQIFRRLGGAAHANVEDAGRYLVMSQALEQSKGELGRYENSRHDGAQIAALTAQMEEFRTLGIHPQDLHAAREKIEQKAFGEKIDELLRIYETYDALLFTVYGENGNILENGLARLRGSGLFAGYEVFVDSFKGFMAGEMALLEEMICTADNVTFAFCTDSLYDKQNGCGLFSPVCRTAAKLMQLAKKNGVPVASPIALQSGARFSSPALAHLEQHIFRGSVTVGADPRGICLARAGEPYGEMEWVAAKISHLIREGKCRYRDIVVIGRDLESYDQAIRTAFTLYRVPYYLDRRFSADHQPFTAAVLTAMEAVRSQWKTENLFALLKTGLTGFSAEQIARLEEYAFVWDLSGKQWEEAFTQNPSGFAAMRASDRERLEQLESLRKRLMTPLLQLRSEILSCSARELVQSLYRYCREAGIIDNLKKQDALADDRTRDDTRALFDGVLDLWDQYALVMGEEKWPVSRHLDLMRLMLQSSDFGQISPSLDSVTVGSAERIRPHGPKYVFLIGTDEDRFPAKVNRDGVLSEREKEQLVSLGLAVTEPFETRVMEERYYAYTALTCAEEGVFVSWSRENTDGKPQQESVIVRQIEEMFPDLPIRDTLSEPIDFYAVDHTTALACFGRMWDKTSPQAQSLARFLQEGPLRERCERILSPAEPAAFTLDSAETAQQLFGKTMRMSPSKVDRFHQCRFAYFCERGLGLRAPRKAQLSPMESGTIVHYVLQQVTSQYPGKELCGLEEETIRQLVRRSLDDYLLQVLGGEPDKSARFKYLFTRMANTLVRLIRQLAMEFSVSRFEPVAFELPIAKDSSVTPLMLQTEDGANIWVEGIVDRVDVMKKGDKRFVRVVDYKTGTKTFDLTDIYYGINLQMLIYLFSICQNGREEMADLLPAGVLYMPGKVKYVSAQRHDGPDEVEKKQIQALKMNGLLLADPDILEGMEGGVSGVFIPAQMKNGEIDAKSSVATAAELGKLKRYIETLLLRMAQTLWAGEIQAAPLDNKGDNHCRWCEYRSVCGREEGDPVRSVAAMDRKRFFEEIGGEENGGK